jgi:hypothetical protein
MQRIRFALLTLTCALAGCAATETSRAAEGPTTMLRDDDATNGGDATRAGDATSAAEAPAGASAGCVVRQSPRTFVGFADQQSLDDFDRTAAEAERVLAMTKVALCRLSARQDRDGTLRAALSGGVVEITAIRFQHKNLASAVLNVQTAPADGTASASALETRWLLKVERTGTDWGVVSAVRQKAKRR